MPPRKARASCDGYHSIHRSRHDRSDGGVRRHGGAGQGCGFEGGGGQAQRRRRRAIRGSLDTLLTKKVGPAFHPKTGYTLVDTSGGSSTLAADIKNKVDVADVFVSAASADDNPRWGPATATGFRGTRTSPPRRRSSGTTPKSKFAKDLRTMPWYKVITMPGFRLGRTNPTQDPGGVLAARRSSRRRRRNISRR